jgi:tetratricopeptide (TPR) repeat protein
MTASPPIDEPLAATLGLALVAHQAGRLDEAQAHYLAVLSRDARHFDALHMLALVHAQRGALDEAERLIARAISVAPQNAAAHFNHGNILLQGKRYGEALTSYERAIVSDPRHAGAYSNRGLLLDALGRPADAVASYDRAISLDPNQALAYTNRGSALAKLGRLAEALASHDKALTLAPNHAEAWHNRATALLELGQAEASVVSSDRAIALNPRVAEPWCVRAQALDSLGCLADALASYDDAIAIDPRHAGALLNRGNVLMKLDRMDEALASYDRALALDPTSVMAWTNRATISIVLGRFADAITAHERALALDPDNAEVHRNLGLARLTVGDLTRGFADFEWRWRTAEFRRRFHDQPPWSGDTDLAGKTILLHGEQGLGDAIQFCRYAPLVARRGARVIVEVVPALAELMRTLPDVAAVVTVGDAMPGFDLYCALMSLPHALGTTLATIPAAVPYLSASAQRVATWRDRLAAVPSPRIGVTWAGNPQHSNDVRRSIALPDLLPTLAAAPASIVTLQKELRPGDAELLARHPHIIQLGDELVTFDDTAAAIAALDLVIAVDTSVAHLAGALGKPVWILVTLAPDWRWLLDRDDSPWYPTARLFRQAARHDWSDVIARIGAEIGRLPHPSGD